VLDPPNGALRLRGSCLSRARRVLSLFDAIVLIVVIAEIANPSAAYLRDDSCFYGMTVE
jgi:hypothetical protein